MTTESRRKRTPEPVITRTNRDWVMIVLGVFLTLLLLAAGYVSIGGPNGKPAPKKRGPVKHPEPMGMLLDQRSSPLCFRLTLENVMGNSGSAKKNCPRGRSAYAAARRPSSPVQRC